MKAKDYLKASQRPEIRIVGLDGKTQKVKRPVLAKFKALCEGKTKGSVTFRDSCTFTTDKPITVSEVQLWYSGEIVAYNKLPEITLESWQTLTIIFALELYAIGGVSATIHV